MVLGTAWITNQITTVEDFYPQEKQEKNAYILLLNNLLVLNVDLRKFYTIKWRNLCRNEKRMIFIKVTSLFYTGLTSLFNMRIALFNLKIIFDIFYLLKDGLWMEISWNKKIGFSHIQ